MESIERAKVKVAVAEVPGKCLKRRLQRSDPLRGNECEDHGDCMVCAVGGRRCRNNGVTYEVQRVRIVIHKGDS